MYNYMYFKSPNNDDALLILDVFRSLSMTCEGCLPRIANIKALFAKLTSRTLVILLFAF